jgi:hypothetical protein
MNLLWDQEPLVAPADFSPFTGVVASPVELQDPSSQPQASKVRASTRPDAVTRPRRRSLLELGLAHGAGAAELEARARAVDTARRQQDRASGVDREPAFEQAGGVGQDGGTGEATAQGTDGRAEGQRVQAIAALAEEIRTTLAATKRLTGELKDLETKQEVLQRQLTSLLECAQERRILRQGGSRPEDGRGLRQDGGRAVLT